MLDQLCTRLATRSLAAQELRLRMELDPQEDVRIQPSVVSHQSSGLPSGRHGDTETGTVRRESTRMDADFKSEIRNQKSEFEVSVSPRLRAGSIHRRSALWQVERAARYPGPLLDCDNASPDHDPNSPLASMTPDERLVADFHNTGLTVGPHPMAYRRAQMNQLRVRRAADLAKLRTGNRVRTAGCVIARQRPGTASGFVFLSLEDETGIANVIITPQLFEQHRMTVAGEQFLLIEGVLQHQEGVVSIRAEKVVALHSLELETSSHDFH
jgi:DNA polymerase III alpha subunit